MGTKAVTEEELDGYEFRGWVTGFATLLFVIAGLSGFFSDAPTDKLFYLCYFLGLMTTIACDFFALEKIQRRVRLDQLLPNLPLWAYTLFAGSGCWAAVGLIDLIVVLKGGVPSIRDGVYMMKLIDTSYVPVSRNVYLFNRALGQMLFGAFGSFLCIGQSLLYCYGSQYLRKKHGLARRQ